ncbi:TetR/AcrR family transcriptional regulator [Actinokineospora fastidiosa]|uniref:TetR family transcriptional regulator n=1 Tax=Actinokineospora fastidiosa TaxID=1816 RepID=A0A918G524_9PSEU|nr:TetR/AcrR family transcriptional regulator [Actinokineospora fastidiosa]GGS19258.1 TetR family transcriptional regulator [Actinokineospora fastidiosa]
MQVTARREQIAQTAIAIIGEHGFAQCTFKRITEEAGLSSTRLVSYHFKDKNELLMTLLTTTIGRADELMAARLAGTTDRVAMLRGYIESQVDLLRLHPAYARTIVEVGRHVADFAPVLRDFRVGRLERQLAQGKAEGVFGDIDVTVTAQCVRSAIDGATERSAEGLDMADYGRAVADLFVKAVLA